jgi:hypothetical protein
MVPPLADDVTPATPTYDESPAGSQGLSGRRGVLYADISKTYISLAAVQHWLAAMQQ